MTDAYECEPSWGDAKDLRPQQCATELAARERLLLHARDLALVRRNSSASVSSRRSSSGSSTSSAATAASAKLEELRRPMESATTLTLPRNGGAGIVLFDPRDLDVRPSWKRKSFALELDTPEQDNDVDDDADEEEEDEESEDENNQRTPEERAERATTARLRRQAVEEICTTEQSYVRDLRTLHDYYIAVLEDRKHPIIEDAQIAVFFNNVRQLVMLNSKLLADLVAIMEKRKRMVAKRRYRRRQDSSSSQGDNQAAAQAESSETEGIGAMFCRYAPLFKLYGGYARDYEEVAGLVNGYKKDSRLRFTDFLAECKERSSSNKDFESLLILPIQRIPRYKMLLERVVKYTAPDHPDADALGRAVKSISDAASHINETVRDQENLASVLQAQAQFAGQLALFTPNRRLIKSGKLTKMSTKRPEEVVLHLFNDLLLYSGVLITGGYRIRRVVNLNSKAVGVKTQIPKSYQSLFAAGQLRADCGFVITSLEKTFILFAPTPDEQVKWVDAIKLAISDAQAKAENTTGETAADAAALWVPDEVVGSCTICHSAFTFYFRRHHCRRCGAVVCGNCSTHRSILFVVDSAREERVCNPCFRVLDLVKVIAFRWLSRLVEFRGVLRRNRANKWSEHYFELRRGVLMQYKLAQSDSEHKGRRARVCTDSLDLAGAIVIHRADTRSQKNRFCFQISTSEYDLEMLELVASPYKSEESTPVAASTPVLSTPANNNSGNNLIFKLSPLKQAVSRFGDAVASRGAPFDSTLSDDSNLSSSRTHAKSPTPTHAIATVATTSTTSVNVNAADWILCATSYSDEMSWTDAIQRSADRALSRTRRSRVTESSIIPMMSFDSGRPQTAGNSVPTLTLSLGARPTDAELSMIMSGDDESSVVEHRRLQILKELIRSEESYVTCLGECICMYVQPLLLRQLEGQKLMRRRQQMKYKKSSLLHQLGRLGHGSSGGGSARNLFSGSPSLSPSSAAFSSSSSQRTVSTSSITSVKTRKFAMSPGDYAAAAASLLTSSAASGSNLGGSASASGESSSGNTKRQQELLVMNADMAIFFSSVDQMCTLNQQLLEHLSRHVDELSTAKRTAKDGDENSEHRVYRVGAIFHAYAPLLQLYTAYASRHASALQAIDSPQFANFLKDLPQEASITRLWRYLNMPMERIPRYKMFLQELLEVTPPDHLDFAPLQAAIRSVDLVADKIQEISDRRDNARKLEEVGAKVGLDLRGRGRFVKDGLLRKVCRSKVQKYYFVLLEDAIVYGRHGGGLTKKRFKLIDLWECKVSNETESMPGVISAVANSNSAFCFYSPLKSFILLTDSAEEKSAWTTSIGECIARTLRGQTHPRRASVRSDLLLDDEERSHLYDLEATCSTLVIKNGWLNVSSDDNRKSRRLWITLTMQTLSLSSAFKAAQPEESFAIENCSASLVRPGTRFKVELTPEADAASASAKRTIVLEAQSLAEREEWVRALSHCIAGSHELPKTLDMRRRSVNQAMLAPIFMFDKVSNVCTICTQTFAVYRPRHHCRLCGSLVCGNCSRKRWTLAYGSSKKASRICDSCATANLTTSSSLASPPHA